MLRILPTSEYNITLSVAPMMKYTDRHCRYFHRLLSPSARLYTEMVTTAAIIHGNWQKLLAYNQPEHPVALQLGGSDPSQLALCAKIAEQLGYDEVNLNCGCPSERVKNGRFGACLMQNPNLVADCVASMRAATNIAITVKSRIGVDDVDSYESFERFAAMVINAGCDTLIVHARKALLQGLNPRQNRNVPPLKYDFVYRLKKQYPDTPMVINGGIATLETIRQHLNFVDGVMLGRQAYHHPRSLIAVEQYLSQGTIQTPKLPSLIDIYQQYTDYSCTTLGNYHPKLSLMSMARHSINLFEGFRGSKLFRRSIGESAHKINNATDAQLLTQTALAHLIRENS